MSLLVRTSTDNGALLVRDTDDPFALSVTESTSPLALRVRESTSPLAMRVRGLFSPASLPGLAAWYDASDSSTVLTSISPDVPATNGQTVRRWLDKSGAGRHLNQTDLVNQPTLNTSVSGVVGNGTSAFMTASFPVLEPQTIYFVAIANTNVSGHRFMDGMATNRNMLRNLSGGLNALTGASNVSVTGDIFQRFIGGAVFASAGAGAFYGLTFAAGTLSNGVTDALGLTLLSSNGGGSNWLDGIIFERISYGAAHDAATRERVIRYLARKWGITV
jgi:hypothetical protein